jgi:uncharacterized damage-inducible protein DinB
MDPIKIYDYLTKSREKVFDAVRALTPAQYARESAIGLNSIGRTLTHMMIVEWSYIERMQQHTLPPYEQWPIQDEKPPAFAVIEKTWREQAPNTRAVLEKFWNGGNWDKEFEYISQARPANDGKLVRTQINVSPADLFTQLTLHEMHHRAQVMAMLRECGSPPLQDIDFGYLMFKRKKLE